MSKPKGCKNGFKGEEVKTFEGGIFYLNNYHFTKKEKPKKVVQQSFSTFTEDMYFGPLHG